MILSLLAGARKLESFVEPWSSHMSTGGKLFDILVNINSSRKCPSHSMKQEAGVQLRGRGKDLGQQHRNPTKAWARHLANSPDCWLALFPSDLNQMRDAWDTNGGETLPVWRDSRSSLCLSYPLLLIKMVTRSSLGRKVSSIWSGSHGRNLNPKTGTKAETVKERFFLACSIYFIPQDPAQGCHHPQ